ncbi:MAG: META domain-containing protein [Chloroflexota bacterium]
MNAIGRIGLTLSVLTLVACAQAPGASPTPSPTPNPTTPPSGIAIAGLDGRQFLSTRVTVGGAPTALVPNTQIRLSFSDGNNLGGSAGCNIFGGTYVLDGDRIVWTGGGMTEMGCDDPRHAQDDWLTGFLASGPTYVLNGNDLTLTSGDTVISLLDREIAEPDQPLAGPTWLLSSLIIGGDAVSSVPGNVAASITFNADGSVDVHFGCNSGGGRYAVDGDTIAFGDLVMTEMACAGDAGMVESAVIDVLTAGPLTFMVDANSLTLTAANTNGLQFIAQ